MPIWEYKTVARQSHEMLSEEQLNVMGTNGFEMVQALSVEEKVVVVGRHETVNKVYYFFKRARPAQAQAPKPATPPAAANPAPKPPPAPAAT